MSQSITQRSMKSLRHSLDPLHDFFRACRKIEANGERLGVQPTMLGSQQEQILRRALHERKKSRLEGSDSKKEKFMVSRIVGGQITINNIPIFFYQENKYMFMEQCFRCPSLLIRQLSIHKEHLKVYLCMKEVRV